MTRLQGYSDINLPTVVPYIQTLKQKLPQQWRAELEAITDPDVRNRATCLIWWHFFGHRSVSNRRPHLDEFIGAPYVPVSDTQLKRALCQCGYSPEMAHRPALSRAAQGTHF